SQRRDLVHCGHHRLLCHHRLSREIRAEDEVFGEDHTSSGNCDRGLTMEITRVRIRPANQELVKAYASICFDHCFLVHVIKVIEAPTGFFITFPTKNLGDGTHWDVAFPANTETRRMIERALWVFSIALYYSEELLY